MGTLKILLGLTDKYLEGDKIVRKGAQVMVTLIIVGLLTAFAIDNPKKNKDTTQAKPTEEKVIDAKE
jgi:hypothetical protein